MVNLDEQLDVFTQALGERNVPEYIPNGLRPGFDLRPYQLKAITNFIRYFETESLRQRPSQTLFHMATGSGKTLVMAALALYLYEQSYNKFVFYVNTNNVLAKTRDNLLNQRSSKYLFAPQIMIDGDAIEVREVKNFQNTDPTSISIRLCTIQGLQEEVQNPREGGLTEEDFEDEGIVFISDEAHHLNALTRRDRSDAEDDQERSWEGLVRHLVGLHENHVLLEFTATVDLQNALIAEKYADRIVASYPLATFREDGFSKEIQLLQSQASTPTTRTLQALVLSQYRLRLFEKTGIAAKPVVMTKARTIKESMTFAEVLRTTVRSLTGQDLLDLQASTTAPVMLKALSEFASVDPSLDTLAADLREEFDEDRWLTLDSKQITPEKQVSVNTLEARNNPYRLVLAVDMLNEGWDVLNLFDIVRLYDTRDAKAGRPGKTTLAEAQLIGRGARYFPFAPRPSDDRYRRKFDNNLDDKLRICEELYYHSATNSRYIDELKLALRESGALPNAATQVEYVLKDSFRRTPLFQQGWVFRNRRLPRDLAQLTELPASVRQLNKHVRAVSGSSVSSLAFGQDAHQVSVASVTETKQLRDLPYAVVDKAARQTPGLNFAAMAAVLPQCTSMRQFLTSPHFLGDIQISLERNEIADDRRLWLSAAVSVIGTAWKKILQLSTSVYGTDEFTAVPLRDVFSNRRVQVSNPSGEGLGIPQSTVGEELRMQLSSVKWYGYTENFGTTEEKRFLRYMNTQIDRLRGSFEDVVVLRNESQLKIYDFDSGRGFEPDFVVFMRRLGESGATENWQVFVEPKGGHLREHDRWKQEFLLAIGARGIPVTIFVETAEYQILGLPFFGMEPGNVLRDFESALRVLGQ